MRILFESERLRFSMMNKRTLPMIDIQPFEMERVFEFLENSPQAARERTEITPPVRVHPYGSHMIIYLIDGSNNVFILRVRHGREDWTKMPL